MNSLKILVVDDEDIVRINMAAFLEDEGFEVRTTRTAEDALILLVQEKFDVGIIDIRLPQMDGNVLIQKMHQVDSNMKFLIHTGSINYTLPELLKTIGVQPSHVFQKPLLDMGVMVNAIFSLINNKKEKIP